jgi:hypothetical protein
MPYSSTSEKFTVSADCGLVSIEQENFDGKHCVVLFEPYQIPLLRRWLKEAQAALEAKAQYDADAETAFFAARARGEG